mgnify:CR=1 FL=1
MAKKDKTSNLVYSTELGRTCPTCENSLDNCSCTNDTLPEGDGIVRISLDTKGRKGKGVTILKGILLEPKLLKELSKELKKKCGVGGAVKSNDIEIQGDQRELLISLLQQKGYTVKRSGG